MIVRPLIEFLALLETQAGQTLWVNIALLSNLSNAMSFSLVDVEYCSCRMISFMFMSCPVILSASSNEV